MGGGDPATTWGIGDYPRMAARLAAAAERAVDLAQVGPGDRVLDVACGTGNGALAAAHRGARTVGVDIEPALLAVAERDACEQGLEVEWRAGDAQALPIGSGAFDVVLSIFGAMYALDHGAAARELARACAPGARLALAAWEPGSFMSAFGATLAPYLPPPPGPAPPSRWGDPAELPAILGPAGIVVGESSSESLTLDFAGGREAVAFLVDTAGHVLAERPRLSAAGRWQALLDDVAALVAERDAGSGAAVSLRLDYLLASGRPEPQ